MKTSKLEAIRKRWSGDNPFWNVGTETSIGDICSIVDEMNECIVYAFTDIAELLAYISDLEENK